MVTIPGRRIARVYRDLGPEFDPAESTASSFEEITCSTGKTMFTNRNRVPDIQYCPKSLICRISMTSVYPFNLTDPRLFE